MYIWHIFINLTVLWFISFRRRGSMSQVSQPYTYNSSSAWISLPLSLSLCSRRLYSCSINSPDDAWCTPISNQQEASLSSCPDMALASSNEYTQIGACAAQTATEKSSYGTSSSVILPCVEQLNGDNGRPFSHISDHYEIEVFVTCMMLIYWTLFSTHVQLFRLVGSSVESTLFG